MAAGADDDRQPPSGVTSTAITFGPDISPTIGSLASRDLLIQCFPCAGFMCGLPGAVAGAARPVLDRATGATLPATGACASPAPSPPNRSGYHQVRDLGPYPAQLRDGGGYSGASRSARPSGITVDALCSRPSSRVSPSDRRAAPDAVKGSPRYVLSNAQALDKSLVDPHHVRLAAFRTGQQR